MSRSERKLISKLTSNIEELKKEIKNIDDHVGPMIIFGNDSEEYRHWFFARQSILTADLIFQLIDSDVKEYKVKKNKNWIRRLFKKGD